MGPHGLKFNQIYFVQCVAAAFPAERICFASATGGPLPLPVGASWIEHRATLAPIPQVVHCLFQTDTSLFNYGIESTIDFRSGIAAAGVCLLSASNTFREARGLV